MTVSGSNNYTFNTQTICNRALQMHGVVAIGQTMNSEDYVLAKDMLNAMIQNLRARNVFIWLSNWKSFQVNDSTVVTISAVDYECIRPHTAAATDQPGVGAQWQSYWRVTTTLSSTDTWAVGLAAISRTAINLGTNVVGVGDAFTRKDPDDDQHLGTTMTSKEYFNKGDKTSASRPNNAWFKRELGGSLLYLSPYPDTVDDYNINIEVYEFPDDFDNLTDTPDFVPEWNLALIQNLAVVLHPFYKTLSSMDMAQLKTNAKESLANAQTRDSEKGRIRFKVR